MEFGLRRLAPLAVAPIVAMACDVEDGSAELTTIELSTARTLSPLPAIPVDPTNKYADLPAAARLGQKFFFESSWSGPILAAGSYDGTNGGVGREGESGKVSCATCHQPNAWFQDVRSKPHACSVATGWTGRNTPPAVNATFYKWLFWDGRADSLWAQALSPPEGAVEMNTSRLRIAHVIYAKYRTEYDALFEPPLDPDLDPSAPNAARFPDSTKPPSDPSSPWATMRPEDQEIINRIYANFGKAIAAYERLLVSRNAPFDRYVAGDKSALSAPAVVGLKVFVGKAACVACHSGPFFTDDKFHVTGLSQMSGGDVTHVRSQDLGRETGLTALVENPFRGSGAYSDSPMAAKAPEGGSGERGAFRTKALRQVAMTGPYMHGGQLATLRDVVDFYDRGGDAAGTFEGRKDRLMVPLGLTGAEKDSLVAFLESLTGEAIPVELVTPPTR